MEVYCFAYMFQQMCQHFDSMGAQMSPLYRCVYMSCRSACSRKGVYWSPIGPHLQRCTCSSLLVYYISLLLHSIHDAQMWAFVSPQCGASLCTLLGVNESCVPCPFSVGCVPLLSLCALPVKTDVCLLTLMTFLVCLFEEYLWRIVLCYRFAIGPNKNQSFVSELPIFFFKIAKFSKEKQKKNWMFQNTRFVFKILLFFVPLLFQLPGTIPSLL